MDPGQAARDFPFSPRLPFGASTVTQRLTAIEDNLQGVNFDPSPSAAVIIVDRLPEASAEYVGSLYYVRGAGFDDSLYLCYETAEETHIWVSLNVIEPTNAFSLGYADRFLSSGSAAGLVDSPQMIAIDGAGLILIPEFINTRIKYITADGVYSSNFSSIGSTNGLVNSPHAVTVDSTGDIWVADSGNKRIQRFTGAAGHAYETQVGAAGSGNGQFGTLGPYGIAVDGSNHIYVCDFSNNRVQKFTYVAGLPGTPTYAGQVAIAGANGICFDAFTGTLLVTSSTAHTITRITTALAITATYGSFGSGNGQFNTPTGIDTDTAGNIYVADSGNDRVQMLDTNGIYLAQFGGTGSAAGKFNYPIGVAVTAAGDTLWVTDRDNDNITKLTIGGEGQLQYSGEAGVVSATGLIWDPVNNRLGINDTSPSQALDVNGNVAIAGALTITTPLAIAQGGSGQITAPLARAAFGAFGTINTATNTSAGGGNGTTVTATATCTGDIIGGGCQCSQLTGTMNIVRSSASGGSSWICACRNVSGGGGQTAAAAAYCIS